MTIERVWSSDNAPHLDGYAWESLLSQARLSRLHARLAQRFVDCGWLLEVPDAPRVHLTNAMKESRRKHDEVIWEVDRICHALASLSTRVVLLKGAAYVLAGLPPGRSRLFGDIDIMVPRSDLRAVENTLFAAGWIPQKLDPYDERYYRDWMHELPPLQHVARQTLLDVHHSIAPPTSRFAVDSKSLLARASPVSNTYPNLYILSPTDMVLHGVIHLFQEGDFSGGLRDLLDFDDLLRHFGADPSFWPELICRARELQVGAVLFYAVSEARRLFDTPIPAATEREIQALSPPAWNRWMMQALLPLALRPNHPDLDRPMSAAARKALYVRSHWLRMPPGQIVAHLTRKAWMRFRARGQDKSRMRPDARPAI